MITDDKTNTLYVSELLKTRHPQLHHSLWQLLLEENILLLELKNTLDIWCCDYMPVQVSDDEFVMFRYDPDYLYNEEFHLLITNQEAVIATPSSEYCQIQPYCGWREYRAARKKSDFDRQDI
jgi:hypothetical protein